MAISRTDGFSGALLMEFSPLLLPWPTWQIFLLTCLMFSVWLLAWSEAIVLLFLQLFVNGGVGGGSFFLQHSAVRFVHVFFFS